MSAHDLENLVCERLSDLLTDHQFLCDLAGDAPADTVRHMLGRAYLAATTLRSGPDRDRAALLPALLTRVDLGEEGIRLAIESSRLAAAVGLEAIAHAAERSIVLRLAATRVRRGHQLRLVIPRPQNLSIVPATRNEKLVSVVAEAHAARALILANPDQSISSIAARHNRCRTRLGKLTALACLAPDIVTAIVEGRQPATLTARTLQDLDLPLAWTDQRALLGFT